MDGHVQKLDASPAGYRAFKEAGAEDRRDTIRASRGVPGASRIILEGTRPPGPGQPRPVSWTLVLTDK
jgi:hypothetical protein